MTIFFESIYAVAIYTYILLIRIASLFNSKAKAWIEGRKEGLSPFEDFVKKYGHPHLWVHVASAGEFEQARTVIDAYKKQFPTRKILLTFFSPSGYMLRKNYPNVDGVFYLPADTRYNAKRLIHIIEPGCVVFVKYEYWYFILKELKSKSIPVILISAVFRPGQAFWHWWGKPMQACLNCFTQIYTQNLASQTIMLNNGFSNAILSDDTRFDRVNELVNEEKHFISIEQFIKGNKVIMAGSTWPADEVLLKQLFTDKLRGRGYLLIVAPHELSKVHIQSLKRSFPGSVLFSELPLNEDVDCIIIDNIGMLAFLYRYATWAYIGGGFGAGIHNILEPAAYGKPVVFGPLYNKFYEAHDLIKMQGSFSINNYAGLTQAFDLLNSEIHYKAASDICRQYVKTHTGATEQIMQWLSQIPTIN